MDHMNIHVLQAKVWKAQSISIERKMYMYWNRWGGIDLLNTSHQGPSGNPVRRVQGDNEAIE